MRLTFLTVAILAAPRVALACPVCFGQSDSPMALATNSAIFFMLGLTGFVLAGFGGFIFYLMRRATLVANGPSLPEEGHVARKSEPQEGMA
jgi:hypothetical protein